MGQKLKLTKHHRENKMSIKKITVLGSEGQIGSHLVKYLSKKRYTVNQFDVENNPYEDMTIIPNPFLEAVIKNSDFVFFLAFDVGGSRYLKNYQHTFDFINNNSRLMVNTFELLKKYQKPFLFASTQMSNMKHSPYGVLKNIGELYSKSLGYFVVKFWNVYGIEKNFEKSHVITDLIRKGINYDEINLITDGEEEREFLYVEDCCESLETLMLNYENFNSDDEFHVTSFQSTKIIDIANIIKNEFAKVGKNVKVIPSKEKDIVQLNAKNKASDFITKWWKPKTSIEDGINKIFMEMYGNIL
jgi:nucleoside-diphosphate-sugar epimerase